MSSAAALPGRTGRGTIEMGTTRIARRCDTLQCAVCLEPIGLAIADGRYESETKKTGIGRQFAIGGNEQPLSRCTDHRVLPALNFKGAVGRPLVCPGGGMQLVPLKSAFWLDADGRHIPVQLPCSCQSTFHLGCVLSWMMRNSK